MKVILQVIFFIFLAPCCWAEKDETSSIRRLRQALLKDAIPKYNPRTRPVKKHTTTTNVSVTVLVERIADWDLKSGTLRIDGELILSWKDEHLSWDPEQFDGLDNVFFSMGEIWTPEISLWSMSETSYISRLLDWSSPVSVNSSGYCRWWPTMALATHCPPKISNFPFDKTECYLVIGPYAHVSSQISMNMHDFMFEEGWVDERTDSFYGPYIENTEYTVSGKSAKVEIITEENDDTKWSVMMLKMTIQRRSIMYAIYVGLPYVIASAIQIAMFIFTRPGSIARSILSSISLLFFFMAAILVTVGIGNVALNASDAPYAIKCTGVSILLVSINLLISEFCHTWLPKRLNIPQVDKVSILWTNKYLHMVLCKPCTYSIDLQETPNKVTTVSDRMRITDDDNLSMDESVEENKPSSNESAKQSDSSSTFFVLVDRIQLITYVILLIFYHS